MLPRPEPASDSMPNPSQPQPKRVTAGTRISLSVPTQKLEAPDLPGYHLYWFLTENVDRALQGGYEFVDAEDVALNNHNVSDDAESSGNSDMGSRVSVPAGVGSPSRLYLMKIRKEWFDEDQAKLAAINEGVARAIRSGSAGGPAPGELAEDSARKYMKSGQDLFWPKRNR